MMIMRTALSCISKRNLNVSAKILKSYIKNLFLLFIFFITIGQIQSCSSGKSHKPEIDIIQNDTIPIQDKIKFVLRTENLNLLGFDSEQQLELNIFYEKRGYNPLWINDSNLNINGKSFESTVMHSEFYGIPNKRIHFTHNDKSLNWVQKEVYLTAQIVLMLNDLNNGFMVPHELQFKPKKFHNLDSLEHLKNRYTNYPDSLFFIQGVPDTNYLKLKNQLYRFCKAYPIDKTSFNVCTQDKDSFYALTETKKALISKGYLSEINSLNETEYKKALFTFQEHNGLNKKQYIDEYTSKCLNESTYKKVLRTCYALERYRWNDTRPKKCIYINIPEYLLRFYHDDTIRATHKVITGKTENPTPTLSSKIYKIITYPYWTVPQSIANKEILPAVKGNVAYLRKNNFKIYGKSGEINPYTVKWAKLSSTFPYKIVQDPGVGNSLGIVKFDFHNKYGVYLHDTPSKKLFKKDIRAFSHGCIRCENPLELAKLILDYDSIPVKRNYFTRDSLDTLIHLQKHQEIKLISSIPIFIEYTTVTCGNEFPIFHFDIYRKEEKILSFLSDEI